MNIKIVGKELKATDAIKEYIEKKLERLVKYFGEDFEVTATIKTEGGMQVAEMEVRVITDRFRAVTAHRDLYASIDKNVDILEGQIRKMKTRWGVCNYKSMTITLNSELIKYQRENLRYVITHEMCHFYHHNHGPLFWDMVSKYYPDYKVARKELRS